MFRKPGVGESCFDRGERRFCTADRATELGAQPSFISRMPAPGIPYHHLNVTHEIRGCQRMIYAEKRMIGAGDSHKSDVEKPIPEMTRRNSRCHDDIRGSVDDRLLRP